MHEEPFCFNHPKRTATLCSNRSYMTESHRTCKKNIEVIYSTPPT